MISRKLKEKAFRFFCRATTLFSLVILLALLGHTLYLGAGWLTPGFIVNFPSRIPANAGIWAPLWGSIWLGLITLTFAVPLGTAAALFLEEYAPDRKWVRIIKVNISNLAGMPSIIYGLLGLAVFVRILGLGQSLLSGGLTLGLLVLPVIIIAAQESVRAVPLTIREAAYALGARKWQVTFFQVLPAAIPGILTGVILAMSRAIGETAPLIVVGALSYVAFTPNSPMDSYTALPVQIFNWAGRPQEDFHGLAAAGIIVLLLTLFLLNLAAIIIRERQQRYRL